MAQAALPVAQDVSTAHNKHPEPGCPRGEVADCNSGYAGANPAPGSNNIPKSN